MTHTVRRIVFIHFMLFRLFYFSSNTVGILEIRNYHFIGQSVYSVLLQVAYLWLGYNEFCVVVMAPFHAATECSIESRV